MYYVGLDVHKKSISYCVKRADGVIEREGSVPALRAELSAWAKSLPQPWMGAMEATLFSDWIYDHLRPMAADLRMGHPARMKAIAAGKKKSDTLDARTIADLLRCNLLPPSYVMPAELRQLRRVLRYRNLLVRASVQMRNKIAGLLMEMGVPYDRPRLHAKKYKRADPFPNSAMCICRPCSSRPLLWRRASIQFWLKCAIARSYAATATAPRLPWLASWWHS
jgi:transposase